MLAPNPFPIYIPAILWLIAGPFYIRYLKRKMFGQYIREDGPESHHKKAGTPTMGGLLILLSVLGTLLGFVIYSPVLLTPAIGWSVLVLLLYGALGFSDDWLKVAKHKNKGVSGWTKLLVQALLGLALGGWMMLSPGGSVVDFWGLGAVDFGWAYPLFAAFILTGASNAYNLTDGLDGLAGACGLMTFVAFAFMLSMQPSLLLLSLLLAGGCLGFLVFNRYPAKIFMGDTGSLALGGVMGAMGVLGKMEMFLALLCGIYLLETISVILQVGYFKLTKGKRLFKMSPIHHHFELSGWKEPTIVFTFAMAQLLFSLVAVLLYNRG